MRTRLDFASIIALVIFSFTLSADIVRTQTPLRILTPDDVIGQEVINGIAISPDHNMLTYLRWRPSTTSVSWLGMYRGDVWIRPIPSTGVALNITQSESKGKDFTYSTPTWSPDGAKLAMLSFSEAADWHVAVWDRHTNRLTEFDRIRPLPGRSISWFDNYRLLLTIPTRDSDAVTSLASPTSYASVAYKGAVNTKNGVRSTSSVLDSGAQIDLSNFPQERLALMGLDGTLNTLASGVGIRDALVSPNKLYVALLRQTGRRPLENATTLDYDYQDLGHYGISFGLEIVDLAGKSVPIQFGTAQFIKPRSFKWGPDSKSFALVATTRGDPLTLHIFRGVIGGTLRKVNFGSVTDVDISRFTQMLHWTKDDSLLVALEHFNKNDSVGAKRLDWWQVPVNGTPRLISQDLKSVPTQLSSISNGRALIGIADGDVWRFSVNNGRWTNLTGSFAPRVIGIRQSDLDSEPATDPEIERALMLIRDNGLTDYYSLDLVSGETAAFTGASKLGEPVAYDAHADTAVFLAAEDTGTYVTLIRPQSNEQIAAVNENLRQIASGKARPITYRGLDGQQLKGWLLLPVNYEDGKRYPLVTCVYAGEIYDTLPSSARTNANMFHSLPWQLFASRGFAVLAASMPLPPEGLASDVYVDLTKGVLPAIDKTIELGIADPDRLAVCGWSFGGYSTFGLITQTNRFKAAIAVSGISDLSSFWGTFGYRYFGDEKRQLAVFAGLGSTEAGQERMGNPPWKDAARYTRNSPLFYADRVQTPLLIVHGDLDANVPIQQSEEFYTAMFRLGKRARYVQYTGESHAFRSPANIRDMWMQIYAWLDEFCDISRDSKGRLVFDGDHVKSRNGAAALTVEDFTRLNKIELQSHPWITRKTEPSVSVTK